MSALAPPFPARSYAFSPYVPCNNWVGGQWTAAASGESLPVHNPRHGEVIGHVALSSAADVDQAVAAARAAFPGWKDTPLKERVQVLFRLKALMERDLDELSWLVSHENGKVLAEARADVLKGVECLEFGLSLENMAQGEQLDVSRGINCSVTHEPLGVVGGVVPFNFPIMVPLWMIPQALAAGNCFVLKPSELVPYGALKLAALLHEAGLPGGVFNTVNGSQPAVEALVDHPGIKAMGFVGSTRVARALYARGAALGKRMLCLGGAKNHLLVAPDADLEMTATTVVASAYGCAGQRCMAASTMIAIGDTQAIVDAIAENARKLRLGEDMGPVIHQAAVDRIHRYIDEAEQMGARVLVDGRRVAAPGGKGAWVGPTVLDHVRPDMPAGCEEIFGPVLSILRARTVDEAIVIENQNPYGNAASIFTSSGAVARYCIDRFEAGMCGVNVGVPVPREPFGFGGWNYSLFGQGDLTGYDGYRFWTRPRKLTSRWALSKDATWMS
jgi:malonate-semialdehyde dehydrogenase (acetylating)/methylmalonate-semialdehyde dehydrogenase